MARHRQRLGLGPGLMALPNLVALPILSPVVARVLREFTEREAAAAHEPS